MLRSILSVIVGYITMAALVFIMLFIAYATLGADGAFQPGVYETSTLWAMTALVTGIVAAVAGGIACAAIARRANPPRALAGLVLVLGLLYSIPRIAAADSEPAERASDVPMSEAISYAREPSWFLMTTPVTGAIGVLLGAGLLSARRSDPSRAPQQAA